MWNQELFRCTKEQVALPVCVYLPLAPWDPPLFRGDGLWARC